MQSLIFSLLGGFPDPMISLPRESTRPSTRTPVGGLAPASVTD
jgi:hypothetical protein